MSGFWGPSKSLEKSKSDIATIFLAYLSMPLPCLRGAFLCGIRPPQFYFPFLLEGVVEGKMRQLTCVSLQLDIGSPGSHDKE